MILLDTNVISEPWRPQPSEAVRTWFDAQDASALYLCTPVIAELCFGAERLPHGARRRRLEDNIDRLHNFVFRNRILPFDITAASEFGRVGALRERLGKRMEPLDAMIAAIALAHDFKLATRDIDDFADLDLELINPFEASVER